MGRKLFLIILLISLIFPFPAFANLTFTSPTSSIDATQELEVQVLIDLTANSSYYLEGAFKKSDGTNYFGLTWNDSDWIAYQSSKSTSFKKITTDSQGKWEGPLKVKLDTGSSNFGGEGDYTFLVKRFTETGTSATNSDPVNIHVSSSIQTTPEPSASTQPTSNPSSTPEPTLDSFAISDTPSTINSDASFATLVQLNQLQSNTTYYIKGAFYKGSSTNYFGKTLVNGNWIKNSGSATSQFKITTDSAGNWVGSLEVMPDNDDSGFSGSGGYNFKVARYKSAGSDLTWSNNVSLTINYIASSTPSPSQKPTGSPASSSQPSSSKTTLTSFNSDSTSSAFSLDEASVEGIATTSSEENPQVLGQSISPVKNSSIHWGLVGGGVLALIGSCYPLVRLSNLKLKFLNFKNRLL